MDACGGGRRSRALAPADVPGRGRWDGDALRDVVRDYALETLADPDAVLVIDETGFLKQGEVSCSVARQYTGSAGKITNCQIGVLAACVSKHGYAFIGQALYLPTVVARSLQSEQVGMVIAGVAAGASATAAAENSASATGCAHDGPLPSR